MALKASDIPDSEIKQVTSNNWGIYYRLGANITVVSFRSKRTGNECFLCLTCDTVDLCPHTKATRRYCGHPLHRTEDNAA